MAKKRHRLSMRKSKKLFTKTAKSSHPKNNTVRPTRGGIRL